MRITSFEVTNYKSFNSSGRIYVEPGFNVIVGQNNVGKAALAEALSLDFIPNPHRSQITIRTPTDQPDFGIRDSGLLQANLVPLNVG